MVASNRKQLGTSLIEILISLIVLTFASLGALAMQAHSLMQEAKSNQIIAASLLADEMAELIRENKTFADKYAIGKLERAHGKDVTCLKRKCSAAENRSAELHNWSYELNRQLLRGRGYIYPLDSQIKVEITYDEIINAERGIVSERHYSLLVSL